MYRMLLLAVCGWDPEECSRVSESHCQIMMTPTPGWSAENTRANTASRSPLVDFHERSEQLLRAAVWPLDPQRSKWDVTTDCTVGIGKPFRCAVVKVWRLGQGSALQYLCNDTQIVRSGPVGSVVDCYHSLPRMKPNAVFLLLCINSCCRMGVHVNSGSV